MIQPSAFQSLRKFSLAAICVILAACSTMQKSSTGSGDQAAAPISEAAKPETAAKPDASAGKSSNSTGAAGQSNSNPANSSGAAGANAGSRQRSSEGSTASSDNDEAAQLKRQLAEQDAQINKLRSDQLTGADQLAGVGQEEPVAGREAMDAAKQSDQQSAAGTKDQAASPGEAATSKAQDELAIFPRDGKTADDGSGQPALAPVLDRSVYFGYDQFSVPDKYDSMLIAHAAYLKAHPDVETEVQGNCDERGSREYNLALGARRAESVKRALELAGADGGRINAISYGSEKPVATGKDEESYSQNRRADIVY
ncbi:MAG: peptidoglycan-associated lipoprotein Pal [Betaproteobacteria bacterium]|nr:peptidoglycan-associated lipoprotein Pal [Betaproteobacteria bacterium]